MKRSISSSMLRGAHKVTRLLGEQRKQDQRRIRRLIQDKRQQLVDIIGDPDRQYSQKISFVFGMSLIVAFQWTLLLHTMWIGTLYGAILLPLMAYRYAQYHSLKYHYFLLDFCYFCNLLLVIRIWFSSSTALFASVFTMSNGTLLAACVMWNNAIVFHDMDKVTSFYIHFAPALVTYALRWYSPPAAVCVHAPSCALTLFEAIVPPFMLYLFWQLSYLVKTELLDRSKLQKDRQIMTSARWLGEKKPHPIKVWCDKRGIPVPTVLLLVLVQLVIFLTSSVAAWAMWHSQRVHVFSLWIVFFLCVWSGANFYFEKFSSNHQKWKKAAIERKQRQVEYPEPPRPTRPYWAKVARSSTSLVLFLVFLVANGALLWYLIPMFILPLYVTPS